jgi:hypothetical protein
MLGLTRDTARPERPRTLSAFRWFLPRPKRAPLGFAAAVHQQRLPHPDDEALPAIVLRARDDARCRLAMARLGYVKVRAHYAQARRDKEPEFTALGHLHLWPSMDFVRDWLIEERKRIVVRARWPFLMTMLATIVAGIVFVAVARVLE